MTHLRFTTSIALAAGVTALLAGSPLVQDDLTLPARFRCAVMILNAQPPGTVKVEIGGGAVGTGSGEGVLIRTPPPAVALPPASGTQPTGTSAMLAITIDRWSTEDEQAALVQTLKSGGAYGLVTGMEKMTVGYLQVNADLRLPIRLSSTWMTDKGRVVRLATNGPIVYPRSASRTLGTDYPIGIVEFTLPPAGRGEGTLVAATRAAFDEQGRIMPVSLAMDTGTQRLTNVERETPAAGGAEQD